MIEYHQRRVKDPDSVPNKYDTVLVRKDGDLRTAYITVIALPEADKWLVSALDITDLKKTQKKLEKNILLSRALTEYALDGIITTDAYGKILYFNNSLLEMFGYSRNQLKNSQLTKIMPERYRKNFMDNLKTFRATGEHRLAGRTIETIGLKKEGNEFPFEMSLTKWEIGEKLRKSHFR
jgi:PAS domain S-box-containing protein